MKTLNLNAEVMIKLTDFGKERLKERDEEVHAAYPWLRLEPEFKVDKNGYCKMPLWQVMDIFGDMVDNSVIGQHPFDWNIKIKDSEFEK